MQNIMNILNKHITVVRKDMSIREVVVMFDRCTGKYAFVNMTSNHVCKCRFDSPDDAFEDLMHDDFVDHFYIDGMCYKNHKNE